MWDLATGEPRRASRARHDGRVEAVAIGELSGRPIIISGGSDRTVRVWVGSGTDLAVINVGSTPRSLALHSRTIVLGAGAGLMAIQMGAGLLEG